MVIAGRAVFFLFSSSVPLLAQAVSGTIRDESGGALPAALVAVRNVDTGAERKLQTDESGRFSAPSLAAGVYRITVEKQGFATQVRIVVHIPVADAVVVDCTLGIGPTKQERVAEEARYR